MEPPLACLYCAGAVPDEERPGGWQEDYCSASCVREHYVELQQCGTGTFPRFHPCPTCRAPVAPHRAGQHGRKRIYCSKACGNRARFKPKQFSTAACDQCGAEYPKRMRTQRFCSAFCSDVYRGQRLPSPLERRVCALPECDVEFQPGRAGQRCCSEPHGKKLWNRENPEAWNDRKRDVYHRRRALKAGTSNGEPVRLSEIAVRDGNRCHLCRKKVPSRAYPHPLSPSLDHVVPLSKGGAHEPSNVRLAHLRCNVEKGAEGGNEQLLLIG